MSRPDKLPKFLSEDAQKRLFAEPNPRYFSPHRDLLLMRVMREAGLRVSEAVSLKPEHVDMRNCRVTVREGKGAKDRLTYISSGLRDEIAEWIDRRDEEAEGTEWLFPTKKGTKVDPNHLRRSVKRYAEKAGIDEVERVSPHTLRHTFATAHYRQHGDIRRLQKLLGHSDISTTMIYTHMADEELEEGAKESAEAFAEEIMG